MANKIPDKPPIIGEEVEVEVEVKSVKPKGFDVAKALDKADFVEFLANNPNNNSTPEYIEEKKKSFDRMKEVREDYKKILTTKLQGEIGIRLSPDDLKCVDTYFANLAISNPEKIESLQEEVGKFNSLPKEIAAKEAEIAKHGGSSEVLDAKLAEIEKNNTNVFLAQDTVGLAGLNRFIKNFGRKKTEPYNNQSAARTAVEEYAGREKVSASGLRKLRGELSLELQETTSDLDTVKKLESKKEELEGLFKQSKDVIFDDMKGLQGLVEIIKKKIEADITELLGGKTVQELEKANEKISKLVEASNDDEGVAVAGMNGIKVGEKQTELNNKLQAMVRGQFVEELDKLTLGDGAYSRLKKTLEGVVKKKTLGTMDANETRAFMKATLTNILDNADKNLPDVKLKSVMLAHIISTI